MGRRSWGGVAGIIALLALAVTGCTPAPSDGPAVGAGASVSGSTVGPTQEEPTDVSTPNEPAPVDLEAARVLVASGDDLPGPAIAVGDRVARLLAAAQRQDGQPVDRRSANDRLLAASESGDPDGVALALRAGARIEARDDHQRTSLLLASTFDRVAVAKLLVALGADPDALDDRHDTPWLVTGVTGSVEMLETLLPADPDLTIRNRFGGISVIPASERGHVDYVRRVVQTGIDVNHVNDLGWTALLEAVILGDGSTPYQEIVRVLLDAGADPSIPDGDGVTALQHARLAGKDEIARILAAR